MNNLDESGRVVLVMGVITKIDRPKVSWTQSRIWRLGEFQSEKLQIFLKIRAVKGCFLKKPLYFSVKKLTNTEKIMTR